MDSQTITRPLDIAFYAPLKAPDHPVPSGDRLMARMLIRCLAMAGHSVTVISDLRAYLRSASDLEGWARLQSRAAAECTRVAALWDTTRAPDLMVCYHPYYKSPDLIGPVLAARFGLPYVTCEASYSTRRNIGIWADMQAIALTGVINADLNLCLTERDMRGLAAAAPAARLKHFAPFIATEIFQRDPHPESGHLVSVAMMRAGDKFESYVRLAATLALLPPDQHWHLSIAGDGPLLAEVQALFADLPKHRISWLGRLAPEAVANLLAKASVYVWPGCGEAYGLAYLEALAAAVPVVAQRVAGVPEVVTDGVTGFLTAAGDDAAAAGAILRLLRDGALQLQMGQAARAKVLEHHALAEAARRMNDILQAVIGRRTA